MTDLPVNQIYFDYIFEGSHMGTHALHVRLQGCASECLTCERPAACDNYAEEVTVDKMLEKGAEDLPSFAMLTEKQLVAIFNDIQPAPYPLVICGGDPAYYDLLELTDTLNGQGYETIVATKGAIPMAVDVRTFLSVRPNSGKIAAGVLVDADEVIFEVKDEQQLRDVSVLLEYIDDDVTEIFLTPAFDCPEALELCMRSCPEKGFRLSYRPDSMCLS